MVEGAGSTAAHGRTTVLASDVSDPLCGTFGPPKRSSRKVIQDEARLKMERIPLIEIVRRAYRIWEDAGKPDGKDQEFYFQAERELEEERREAGECPRSMAAE